MIVTHRASGWRPPGGGLAFTPAPSLGFDNAASASGHIILETRGWTEDDLKTSARLFAEGLSFTQIQPHLDQPHSRSSIGASLNRRGLKRGAYGRTVPRQPRPARRVARVAFARNSAPTSQAERLAEIMAAPDSGSPDETKRCTLMALNSTTCRYPHGDPGTAAFYFCGSDVFEGLPYCWHHSRIAFQLARRPAGDRPFPR